MLVWMAKTFLELRQCVTRDEDPRCLCFIRASLGMVVQFTSHLSLMGWIYEWGSMMSIAIIEKVLSQDQRRKGCRIC